MLCNLTKKVTLKAIVLLLLSQFEGSLLVVVVGAL
jgi:hypothetical protein